MHMKSLRTVTEYFKHGSQHKQKHKVKINLLEDEFV